MMEEKINKKIKEIKKIILEITQGFPYTKEQINWLTIVYLSFIMLDDEIEDLLMETLHEVFIVFAHDTVKNIYQRLMHNKYDKKFLRELIKDRAIYFNYLVDETGLHGNPFIIIPIDKIPLYDIFDSLFHELKHAINERIPHFFNQNGENYFYSGLSLASKDKLYYENIDEAFNSYLTKIYLDNITYLKNFFITDEEIRNILVQFDIPHPYFYCYNKLVKRYQNLFSSKYLFRLFYYASLYKDFEDLDIAIEDVFKRKIKALDFYDDLDRKREILWYLKHRLYEQKSLLKERQKIVPYIK